MAMKAFLSNFMTRAIFIGFCSLLVWACSSTGTGYVSKNYHNLTAHYNAYFLSKEILRAIDKELFDKRKDNYNKILDIIPPIDTNLLRANDNNLQDCIKKAALVKNWHENSEWVDPAYVLIGKARFYERDYINAITTLKYVNTQAKEEQTKNEALILLTQVFTYIKQTDNARTVLEYLKKQPLDNENLENFYLVAAHYYRTMNDMKSAAKYLERALPMMKNGEIKGRVFFILGQIYQQAELREQAFKYYKKVAKNNPSYELAFYTKLYKAQVHKFDQNSDAKKIMRYYKKLLKDDKNIDYKDKIYYEMALFQLKRDSIGAAVSYLKNSVENSTNNPLQKAYSFLKLAEISYERTQEYEDAKLYYDSALVALPRDADNYELIQKRGQILGEFVKQLQTVRLQDSLLKLAEMPREALSEYLDEKLFEQELKKQKEAERLALEAQKKAAQQQQANTLTQMTTAANWYFYNPKAVQVGAENFKKKWGDRKLEDNWRRKYKTDFNTDIDSLDVIAAKPLTTEEIARRRAQTQKDLLLKMIPFEQTQKDSAKLKLESALYQLGRIYQFDLQEPNNTINTFERFVKEYPQNNNVPEAYYQLYITYQSIKNDEQAERCKQILLSQYPNSLYAKVIQNPNFIAESKKARKELTDAYQKAYDAYDNQHYETASTLIAETLQKYPDNEIQDRFVFLTVLISLRTQSPEQAQKALNDFIEQYADSPLSNRAREIQAQMKSK
ncbi:MAG: hypothetical protein EAZ55_13430 [Cytophagales bacterium]|nr:MAG: hypothetical protein EAZ55_13430 [Cytophagales bacterium]